MSARMNMCLDPEVTKTEDWNKSTWKKEHKDGKLKISYGHDHITGYFIMVADTRLDLLATSEDDPKELNTEEFSKIRYSVDQDEEGRYLNAHTGEMGFGERVSKETMKKLWELYDAGEEQIELIN